LHPVIPSDEDYDRYNIAESYFVQKFTVKFKYYNELYFATLENFPSVKDNPIIAEDHSCDWIYITFESGYERMIHESDYQLFLRGINIDTIQDFMVPPDCKYTQFQSI
jgi:hypothetical protein